MESPDVDRVDELGSTRGRALFYRNLVVKSVRGKASVAMGLLLESGRLVLLLARKGAGNGGGDETLLSVVPTCTSGDAMGDIVVKLSRDRFYGGKRGMRDRVVEVDGANIVILAVSVVDRRAILIGDGRMERIALSDRLVDLGEHGIKTRRNSVRLNVSERSQKGERISVDVDRIDHVGRGGGRAVVVGASRDRIEEGLYFGQVDENAARGTVLIYDGESTRNAIAFEVVNRDLFALIVEKRKVVQYYGTTKVRIGTVEYAGRILGVYGVDGDEGPIVNLGTPERRTG